MTNNRPNPNNRAPRNPEGTKEQQYYAYMIGIVDMTPRGMRTSRCQLFRTLPIRTMNDVLDVEKWVRTNNAGYENASVVGFSLLRMVPASEVRGH